MINIENIIARMGIEQAPSLRLREYRNIGIRNACIYYYFKSLDMPRIKRADYVAEQVHLSRNTILYIVDTFPKNFRRFYRHEPKIMKLFRQLSFTVGSRHTLQTREWYTHNLPLIAPSSEYNIVFTDEQCQCRYVPVRGTATERRMLFAGREVTVMSVSFDKQSLVERIRIAEDDTLTFSTNEFLI